MVADGGGGVPVAVGAGVLVGSLPEDATSFHVTLSEPRSNEL
jgi:hypothetical protein